MLYFDRYAFEVVERDPVNESSSAQIVYPGMRKRRILLLNPRVAPIVILDIKAYFVKSWNRQLIDSQ